MGCAAELTARWRAPFKQLRRVSSRSACVLRHTHHPLPCASRHAQKGTRAKQPHRPSLRSACMAQALRAAQAGPRAAMARVLSTPFWLRLRRGVCGVGMRVEARMLRTLTRRGCPNEAAQQRSEFHGAPRKRPDAGCPFAPRRGRRLQGRLSFGYFSLAKQRKVPRPPGRDPASRPQQSQNHSRNYQNNSCQRLPHRRKSPKTLNISTERNTSSAQPPAPGAGCGCPAPGAAESAAARSPPSPRHRPAPCGGPAPSH